MDFFSANHFGFCRLRAKGGRGGIFALFGAPSLGRKWRQRDRMDSVCRVWGNDLQSRVGSSWGGFVLRGLCFPSFPSARDLGRTAIGNWTHLPRSPRARDRGHPPTGNWAYPPRSPKARDRGHPQRDRVFLAAEVTRQEAIRELVVTWRIKYVRESLRLHHV